MTFSLQHKATEWAKCQFRKKTTIFEKIFVETLRIDVQKDLSRIFRERLSLVDRKPRILWKKNTEWNSFFWRSHEIIVLALSPSRLHEITFLALSPIGNGGLRFVVTSSIDVQKGFPRNQNTYFQSVESSDIRKCQGSVCSEGSKCQNSWLRQELVFPCFYLSVTCNQFEEVIRWWWNKIL